MEHLHIGVLATAVLAFGLVSGPLTRGVVTAPMTFTALGLLLGGDGLGLLDLDLAGPAAELLIESTLLVILFADATRIDTRALRHDAALPGRMLGIGMPVMIGVGTLVALATFDQLGLLEAVLVATMLAPTDAALGQAVVTRREIPVRIRQSLNVESGLNDGIALPVFTIVLALVEAETDAGSGDFLPFVAAQIGYGVTAGVIVGGAGGWLIDHSSRRGWVDGAWQQLATMAIPFLAWALAGSIDGNGFLAAFTGGIAFGLVSREHCRHIEDFTDDTGQLLTVLSFLVFGAVFVGPALEATTAAVVAYAIASLTVVRLVAVGTALIGSGFRPITVVFLGWFGPRGLATILFVLLVAEASLPMGPLIVAVATWTALASIVLHGVTASLGATAYAHWLTGARASGSEPDEDRMEEMLDAHEHPLRPPVGGDGTLDP